MKDMVRNYLTFAFEINEIFIIFKYEKSWNPRLITKFNLDNPIDALNQNLYSNL